MKTGSTRHHDTVFSPAFTSGRMKHPLSGTPPLWIDSLKKKNGNQTPLPKSINGYPRNSCMQDFHGSEVNRGFMPVFEDRDRKAGEGDGRGPGIQDEVFLPGTLPGREVLTKKTKNSEDCCYPI